VEIGIMLTRYGYKCILMGQTDDKAVLDTILTSTIMCLDNRGVRFSAMIFGDTLNNISAISWQAVLFIKQPEINIDISCCPKFVLCCP
jgi:hypothetical protein